MRKILPAILCVISICVFLTGCYGDKSGANKSPLKNTQDIYAFTAFTATSMLSNAPKRAVSGKAFGVTSISNNDSNDNKLTPERLQEMEKYLDIFEGMLALGDPIETNIQKNVIYKDVEYDESITINIKDLDGNSVQKIMYYNESPINSFDEVDEDEVETMLSGILVENNVEYILTGKKELDGDEIEIEMNAKDAAGNTVIIKQEIESGEQEYLYKYFDPNNQLISSSAMEFENENGETEIKLTIFDGSKKDKYSFKKEGNKVLLKYTVDGKQYVYMIKE